MSGDTISVRLVAEILHARRAVAAAPSDPASQQHLGLVLAGAAELPAAVAPLRRATWLAGSSADSQLNLGILLAELQRWREAGVSFRRALGLIPGDADVLHGVGIAAGGTGRLDAAEQHLRRALKVGPFRAETMAKLAGVLAHLRRSDEANAWARRVISLLPGSASAHIDHSAILVRQDRLLSAYASGRRALAIEPNAVQALVNAGAILASLGHAATAVAALRRAADLGGAGPFRNMMGVMCNMPVDQATRWATAREFARRFAPMRRTVAFPNTRDSERRLTVGYLSSDLYDHPVARNLAPILEAHDRSRLRVVCYSGAERVDGMTRSLQAAADGWRSNAGLSDAEVAESIRADAVDVLVVLAGRLDKNRPLVAAERAAPVQISLFDGGTSGLDEMDYLLADRTLVPAPAHRAEMFSERVIRLPSLYVHGAIQGVAAAEVPPNTRTGHVTFGCFNSPLKLSDGTLDIWSRLLRELPHSRLRLKFRERYRSVDLQRRILDGLRVDGDRIDFLWGEEPIDVHLGNYRDVDVALDTFPFTGCTTTFEALWMGVPVVTLLGDTLVSRLSASFLRPAGLDELVASTPDAYIDIAAALAGDPARLASLRATLRDRLLNSPICNGPARARQFERVYRAVWRRWCRSQASA